MTHLSNIFMTYLQCNSLHILIIKTINYRSLCNSISHCFFFFFFPKKQNNYQKSATITNRPWAGEMKSDCQTLHLSPHLDPEWQGTLSNLPDKALAKPSACDHSPRTHNSMGRLTEPLKRWRSGICSGWEDSPGSEALGAKRGREACSVNSTLSPHQTLLFTPCWSSPTY